MKFKIDDYGALRILIKIQIGDVCDQTVTLPYKLKKAKLKVSRKITRNHLMLLFIISLALNGLSDKQTYSFLTEQPFTICKRQSYLVNVLGAFSSHYCGMNSGSFCQIYRVTDEALIDETMG